jgi:hypothetical protein
MKIKKQQMNNAVKPRLFFLSALEPMAKLATASISNNMLRENVATWEVVPKACFTTPVTGDPLELTKLNTTGVVAPKFT